MTKKRKASRNLIDEPSDDELIAQAEIFDKHIIDEELINEDEDGDEVVAEDLGYEGGDFVAGPILEDGGVVEGSDGESSDSDYEPPSEEEDDSSDEEDAADSAENASDDEGGEALDPELDG